MSLLKKRALFVCALLIFLLLLVVLISPKPTSSTDKSTPSLDKTALSKAMPSGGFSVAEQFKSLAKKRQGKLLLPEQDNEALMELALDRDRKKLTYRFAAPIPIEKKISEIGTWKRENGTAIWQLEVQSPNATSLNFALDQYQMPPGGEFRLRGDNGRDLYTFTSADNDDHGELWTPIVRGNTARLEVRLPEQLVPELRFRIAAINHGFRKHDGHGKIGGDTSGSCNVDVVCDENDVSFGNLINFYRNQIRSVGAYTLNGTDTCTGALINNTNNDKKPYFLTANHCGITEGNDHSMVVYWNFENSTCRQPGSSASGGVGDGDLSVFNSGAIFRAAYSNSDFCLVELDDPVNPNANAYFSGWDRTDSVQSMAVGIHHPAVAEKRISFEYDQTARTSYGETGDSSTGTHIRVIDWDEGTTEPGSSGSPLFDQSGRIVGQLHGGGAACGNNQSDWYGRVYKSWTGGGTIATRLSDWLDPAATGATTLDGTGMDELLSITDASFSEGDSGTTVVSLTVTMNEESAETVTCDVAVTGGDADAGSDYVNPGTQTLTFPAGVTSAIYDITINGDLDPEEHESIIVTISNPTNAIIGNATATLLILNDDYITPLVTGPTSGSAMQNTPYYAQIEALNTPSSYSISGEPIGMTVDSLSGEISWPSPVIGNYSITLEATNEAGTGSATLNLEVTVSDIVEAFEIPDGIPFQQTGSHDWAFHTAETFDGEDSLVAAGMGDSSSAELRLTIHGPDILTFYRKVSSESGFDIFEVQLDGSVISSASGEEDWAQVIVDIPSGEHTVTISYTKDGSISSGSDSVWIDQMDLASISPPIFISPFNILVPSGVPVAIKPQAVFNVTSYHAHSLPAGASINQDNYITGTFSSTETFIYEATNAFGTTSREFTITPYTDDGVLADAIAAPTLSFPPASGAAWFRLTAVSRSGGSAIRSGSITHNQTSNLTTHVHGPGTLSFYWRSSSESGFDYGLVYLNGELKDQISGTNSRWRQSSLTLESGLNEITWQYNKDHSITDGQDCLYLDDITLSGFAGWVAAAGMNPLSAPFGSGTDGDSNSSLMEYATGLSPAIVEPPILPTLSGDSGSITISIPINPTASDISIQMQKSSTLLDGNWIELPSSTNSSTLQATDNSGDAKAFYRALVESP